MVEWTAAVNASTPVPTEVSRSVGKPPGAQVTDLPAAHRLIQGRHAAATQPQGFLFPGIQEAIGKATGTGVAAGTGVSVVGREVQYVNFGFESAHDVWAEVVLPAYERFIAVPSRANAIDVSGHAWHIHEWIWHEQHPGSDTRNNKDYESFRDKLLSDCPELAWVRDVADAGKHCGSVGVTCKSDR